MLWGWGRESLKGSVGGCVIWTTLASWDEQSLHQLPPLRQHCLVGLFECGHFTVGVEG